MNKFEKLIDDEKIENDLKRLDNIRTETMASIENRHKDLHKKVGEMTKFNKKNKYDDLEFDMKLKNIDAKLAKLRSRV